jgi:hypothetical protein
VAGAQDLVQWAVGSCTGRTGAAGRSKGCWDVLTTLEEWSLPKTSQQWVTGYQETSTRDTANKHSLELELCASIMLLFLDGCSE